MKPRFLPLLVLALPLSACPKNPEPGPSADPAQTAPPPDDGTPPADSAPPPGDEPSDRPQLTAQECEAKGGQVVGDIGDGAIHRPDYRCADSGQAPVGDIVQRPSDDGPVAVEGSVCCPPAS